MSCHRAAPGALRRPSGLSLNCRLPRTDDHSSECRAAASAASRGGSLGARTPVFWDDQLMGWNDVVKDAASGGTELARIRDFGHRTIRASASGVGLGTGGVAVLNTEFPKSDAHNRLVMDTLIEPLGLMDEADRGPGGSGRRHRAIELELEVMGPEWLARFCECGYQVTPNLNMVLRRPTERRSPTPVARLSDEALTPVVWRVSSGICPKHPSNPYDHWLNGGGRPRAPARSPTRRSAVPTGWSPTLIFT